MDIYKAKTAISNINHKIRILENEIERIEDDIVSSGYDEPTSCMKCEWNGYESELKLSWDVYYSHPPIEADGCPECGNMCEQTDWVKYKYYL